jgi:hypothetical protein
MAQAVSRRPLTSEAESVHVDEGALDRVSSEFFGFSTVGLHTAG